MNLNKRAMEYAKKNNYYRLSKIKKYLVLFDRKIKELENKLEPSICPHCGSECTEIEHDDREYCYSDFMYCNSCGECYDDDKYINQYSEIESMNYFDRIVLTVWAYDFKPPTGYDWFKICDEYMDKMIKELDS